MHADVENTIKTLQDLKRITLRARVLREPAEYLCSPDRRSLTITFRECNWEFPKCAHRTQTWATQYPICILYIPFRSNTSRTKTPY